MRKYICTLVLSCWSILSYGQCSYQVTHLSGEEELNGISITVTSDGLVDQNSGYCLQTLPYMIGYNYTLNEHGTGSYTYQFSPPVSMLTLDFSGISISSVGDGHIEEIQLYVNGAHYDIPSVGTLNGCDPLAVLTPEGNIRACEECPLSGWLGTTIEGPISTLRVTDSVLVGLPGGTIYSLYICDSLTTGIGDGADMAHYTFSPSAMTHQATLKFPDTYHNVSFSLYTISGACIRTMHNITDGTLTLTKEGLPAGLYFYALQSDTAIITTGKILIQ